MSHSITGKCDGCSACFGQCPTAAIVGVFQSRYRINPLMCIDCGVCGAICPVDAVLDQFGEVVPRIPRDQRPRPVVALDACTGCGSCVAICPFLCRVVIGGPHAGISSLAAPERCVGCGECARMCGKGAISMGPVDVRSYDPEQEADRLRLYLSEHE